MEFKVHKAMLDDIDGLIQVYKSDGMEHKRELDSYPLTELILDQKDHFLVAKILRKPVGFIYARKKGDEVKIDIFSVAKKYRGKGAEKKLLDTVEGSREAIKITSYVPKSEKWMVNLFKKQGYMVYNEVRNLFGEGENGIYMVKDLVEEEEPRKMKKHEKLKSYLEENMGKLDIYLEP